MEQELLSLILESEIENLYLVIVLGMVRIFGMMWSFVAFGWAFGSSILLRSAIAFALGLPLMLANVEISIDLASNTDALQLALLTPKEFAIGFGLGLLASGPFRAMQYAGAVTDAFRGESDSGLQSPDGSQLQTFSVLYLCIAFYVFFALDGLWKLIEQLYATYELWPIDDLTPALSKQSAEMALAAIDKSLELAVIIAAPLLILLMSIEFVLMVAAKLARRFGIYDLSFLVKNLVTIVTLPLTAMLIVRVAETYTPEAILGLESLKQFLE